MPTDSQPGKFDVRYVNPYKLNADIVNNLASILNHYKIRFSDAGKHYGFSCPLHGSSKKTSLTVLKDAPYVWACWTNHCEQEYGKYPNDLLRALIHKFDGVRLTNPELSDWLEEKYETLESAPKFEPFAKENKLIPAEHYLGEDIDIPSKYFMSRGFSAEILKKYDIGDYYGPTYKYQNRAIVPIYNQERTGYYGCQARSIFPRCKLCEHYHSPYRICADYPKWLNSKGLYRSEHLFNYWFAQEEILKTGKVILVEGIGDSLKLSQAGVLHNVAVFGSSLSDSQEQILLTSGATEVIVCTDNDKAGDSAYNKIKGKLCKLFTVNRTIVETDVGDMTVQDIRSKFW